MSSASTSVPFGTGAAAVATVCFYRERHTGVYLWGIVKKAAAGEKPYGSGGAAGTKPKHWGKWGSVGGGKRKGGRVDLTNLKAAIKELEEETAAKLFRCQITSKNVDCRKINSKLSKPAHVDFVLHLATMVGSKKNTALFLIECVDGEKFFTMFPRKPSSSSSFDVTLYEYEENVYGMPPLYSVSTLYGVPPMYGVPKDLRKVHLMRSSCGEISDTASVTTEELMFLINYGKCTSYMCKSFDDVVKDAMSALSPAWGAKWGSADFKSKEDTGAASSKK